MTGAGSRPIAWLCMHCRPKESRSMRRPTRRVSSPSAICSAGLAAMAPAPHRAAASPARASSDSCSNPASSVLSESVSDSLLLSLAWPTPLQIDHTLPEIKRAAWEQDV